MGSEKCQLKKKHIIKNMQTNMGETFTSKVEKGKGKRQLQLIQESNKNHNKKLRNREREKKER